MGFLDNIQMALASLKYSRMRSFLTMLGIIIGIASVIAIMTIGSSLSGSITSSLSSFGITDIKVSVTQKSSSGSSSGNRSADQGRMFMRSAMKESDLISDEMIAAYKEAYSSSISTISVSESIGTSSVSEGSLSTNVSIVGVNPDVKTSDSITMITGRFISEDDLTNKRAVCVVSDVFAENLFGTNDPATLIGKTINVTISGYTRQLYIVGEYHYQNSSTSSDTSNTVTSLYMPITTAKRYSFANDGYSSLTVSPASGVDTTTFMNQTQQFFASYYTQNDTYTVEASNLESMVETMESMLSTVTLAIAAIAAISLIVGGIGVMNIMLVSITERTREIGTRKALGATQNDIRLQFITESVIICLIGGAIGIVLGEVLGSIGASLLGFSAVANVNAIVISVLFSMGIGVFFGYYPANKAAKLNPIDALRYE